jgi:hypothetical protein
MSLNPRFTHPARYVWIAIVAFALVLTACINNGTPTTVTEVSVAASTDTETPLPTETSPPTEIPLPTTTPTPPEVTFEVSPALTKEALVGQEFTILIKLDPPVDIVEANWSLLAGDGSLNPNKGELIIFTAPKEPGSVIIQVSGTTVEGASFDEVIPFNVVAPTATPTPTPRPTCEFTAKASNRTSLPRSLIAGEITEPQHCGTGYPTVPMNITSGGTAGELPVDTFLWLFVFAPDGKYYPQCDDASEGRCGVNLSQGKWGVNVFLGQPNCKEHFHLVLVETNRDSDQFFKNTMISWAEANSYDGFTVGDILDRGVRELDGIEVETSGRICP